MKIFNSVAVRKPAYNLFDLSHDKKLSCRQGELVPIFIQDVLPGDKFQVESETLVRLAPMIAPVMHRMNVWVHFFFVPNRLVWDEWQDFITGGTDGTLQPVAPRMELNNVTKVQLGGLTSLGDYMGVPAFDNSVTVTNNVQISALPFRAYQLIWNEYYRDQTLQDPIDFSKASGVLSNAETNLISTMRRRCWEKDYFTSALPFAQRGPEMTLPFEATVTYKDPEDPQAYLDQAGIATAPPGDVIVAGGGTLESTGGVGPKISIQNIESIDSAAITVNELRRVVRLQEWLEANATGGGRYVEQMWVHFGVRSSDARLQRPEYLGGGMNAVSVSEVLATAESAAGPQGNMAGHGISYGRTNRFRRRFEEHGYVIGLMSILPKTAYQQGIPRHLARFDKFDYAWPKLAQIGEQEIKSKEIWYDPAESPSTNEETFGYQSRYVEYKQTPSTVHGYFRDSLAFWHMGRIFEERPLLNEEFVEANPTNRIFAVAEADDQNLWVHIYNNCRAIRPLPYFGTPTL